MKTIVYGLLSVALIVFASSCTMDDDLQNIHYYKQSTNNEYIKSISVQNYIVQKFCYDKTGKIREDNSMYFYHRYSYDKNNRLVKIETAFDELYHLSSSVPVVGESELKTSANSTINSYELFKYDYKGQLSKTEYYHKMTGKKFELRSMNSYEYKGALIVKENLHDPKGKITQYREYTYDNRGNVVKEKYYSNNETSKPELVSEISYQYDNYKNPFRILSIVGHPGFYTNVNNIIETSSILYLDVPGIDKYSSSKQTYKYNTKGYPVKLITQDGSEEEYEY